MAKKLYLTNTASDLGSLPSPLSSYWTQTDLTFLAASETASGTNAAFTLNKSVATNPSLGLIKRFVSPAFVRHGVIDGTFTAVIARLASVASQYTFRFRLIILRKDLTQTLIFTGTYATTWPTAVAGAAFTGSGISTTGVNPDDRLIMEVGYSAANAVTTTSGTIRAGGTAGDLVNGDTTTNATTRSPHVTLDSAGWDNLWTTDPDQPTRFFHTQSTQF